MLPLIERVETPPHQNRRTVDEILPQKGEPRHHEAASHSHPGKGQPQKPHQQGAEDHKHRRIQQRSAAASGTNRVRNQPRLPKLDVPKPGKKAPLRLRRHGKNHHHRRRGQQNTKEGIVDCPRLSRQLPAHRIPLFSQFGIRHEELGIIFRVNCEAWRYARTCFQESARVLP